MKSIEAQYNLDPQTLEEIMTAPHIHAYAPVILPDDTICSYKTGILHHTSYDKIVATLGFMPNVVDDPDKVKYSWGFTLDGKECAVWDWKGSWEDDVWSVYDPSKVLDKIFGVDNLLEGYGNGN